MTSIFELLDSSNLAKEYREELKTKSSNQVDEKKREKKIIVSQPGLDLEEKGHWREHQQRAPNAERAFRHSDQRF